jgi:hypothetical protein
VFRMTGLAVFPSQRGISEPCHPEAQRGISRCRRRCFTAFSMTYVCCLPERARDLFRPEEMLHCVQQDRVLEECPAADCEGHPNMPCGAPASGEVRARKDARAPAGPTAFSQQDDRKREPCGPSEAGDRSRATRGTETEHHGCKTNCAPSGLWTLDLGLWTLHPTSPSRSRRQQLIPGLQRLPEEAAHIGMPIL